MTVAHADTPENAYGTGPDCSAEQRTSNHLVKRIKLRWAGMEEEAKRVQGELSVRPVAAERALSLAARYGLTSSVPVAWSSPLPSSEANLSLLQLITTNGRRDHDAQRGPPTGRETL
jgi:hypothetical protein